MEIEYYQVIREEYLKYFKIVSLFSKLILLILGFWWWHKKEKTKNIRTTWK